MDNIKFGLIILEKASKKHNSSIDLLNGNRNNIINYLKPKKKNPSYWDTWRSGGCWIKKMNLNS